MLDLATGGMAVFPWPPFFHSRRQGLTRCDSGEAGEAVSSRAIQSSGSPRRSATPALMGLDPNARDFARKASTSTSSRPPEPTPAGPCPQPSCAAGAAFRNARQSGVSGRSPGTCRQSDLRRSCLDRAQKDLRIRSRGG